MNAMKLRCKYDDLILISTLKKHPKNANFHPKDQIERLAKILDYQGWRYPVKVSNQTGFVTSGHGRIEAAKLNKWDSVPVSFQDYESEEMEIADLHADNAIAMWSEFNLPKVTESLADLDPMFDLELLGIKGFEIDGKMQPGCDEDEVPEPPKESISKLGDLFKLGEHKLLCGDSTNIQHVERLMNGEKADIWITDPPYGVSYMEKNAAVHGGYVANQFGKEISSDTKSVEELCPFWRDVASNAAIVSTDECSNYWFACQGSDKMMMMMMMMDEAGWNIRHELIWVKDSFVFGRSDYHYRHEPIIYGWKKKGKHNWYGDRKQDSVIEVPRPKKSDLHPTTKPVELYEKFLNNSSKQGDVLLETFCGSGTAIIAAEKTNRKCRALELDPNYIDVIIKRFITYSSKPVYLINDDGTEKEVTELYK